MSPNSTFGVMILAVYKDEHGDILYVWVNLMTNFKRLMWWHFKLDQFSDQVF